MTKHRSTYVKPAPPTGMVWFLGFVTGSVVTSVVWTVLLSLGGR